MNILILGSGGREHAFAWKISKSELCSHLFIAPGNAGTKKCGKNVSLDILNFSEIADFCIENKIEMIVVGSEAPLVAGIYDYFQKETLNHINVVGPSKAGAELEGSKDFSKRFMQRHKIPTASYATFNGEQVTEGLDYLEQQTCPIVLKADGLAAGKGVLICQTLKEAKMEFKAMLSGKFGTAGAKVVVEQFLDGIEFSVFVFSDGTDFKTLPIAKDYKRIGEGDKGLNTGGMGAVSPVPFVDKELMQKVLDRVVKPTVNGLKSERIVYKGFIYVGLILVDNEPFVIEYNCRMGDPETQVVLPRIESDLVELFDCLKNGNLANHDLKISEEAATTIVLASKGYPETYEKGKLITGFEEKNKSIVFHAGTKEDASGNVLTNGGRVMALTSFGETLDLALSRSITNAEIIDFEGKYYRKDIGLDVS